LVILTILSERFGYQSLPHVPGNVGKSSLLTHKPGSITAGLGFSLGQVALDNACDPVDLFDVAILCTLDLLRMILVEPLAEITVNI
jgi:hypothetical protein